jgi:hypothetical protein
VEPIKHISIELWLTLAPQLLLQCPRDFNSEGPLPLSMGPRLPPKGALPGGVDSPALCQVKPYIGEDQPVYKQAAYSESCASTAQAFHVMRHTAGVPG